MAGPAAATPDGGRPGPARPGVAPRPAPGASGPSPHSLARARVRGSPRGRPGPGVPFRHHLPAWLRARARDRASARARGAYPVPGGVCFGSAPVCGSPALVPFPDPGPAPRPRPRAPAPRPAPRPGPYPGPVLSLGAVSGGFRVAVRVGRPSRLPHPARLRPWPGRPPATSGPGRAGAFSGATPCGALRDTPPGALRPPRARARSVRDGNLCHPRHPRHLRPAFRRAGPGACAPGQPLPWRVSL
jgi:hypothetical protein